MRSLEKIPLNGTSLDIEASTFKNILGQKFSTSSSDILKKCKANINWQSEVEGESERLNGYKGKESVHKILNTRRRFER